MSDSLAAARSSEIESLDYGFAQRVGTGTYLRPGKKKNIFSRSFKDRSMVFAAAAADVVGDSKVERSRKDCFDGLKLEADHDSRVL